MLGGPPPEPGFEEAFDRLFPRALRLAGRILGDAAAAEDVASESLARAYARWSDLAWEPWLDGWVLRVATNLALDQARKRQPAAPSMAIEVAMDETTVLRMALAAALARLPRRQRQAVALRYLGDLSDKEVAEAMGVSLGSVKTHIHRGLASLRTRVGQGMEEAGPLALD